MHLPQIGVKHEVGHHTSALALRVGLAFAPLILGWLRPIGLAFAPLIFLIAAPYRLAFAPLIANGFFEIRRKNRRTFPQLTTTRNGSR